MKVVKPFLGSQLLVWERVVEELGRACAQPRTLQGMLASRKGVAVWWVTNRWVLLRGKAGLWGRKGRCSCNSKSNSSSGRVMGRQY